MCLPIWIWTMYEKHYEQNPAVHPLYGTHRRQQGEVNLAFCHTRTTMWKGIMVF